jgi:hypothetical protein
MNYTMYNRTYEFFDMPNDRMNMTSLKPFIKRVMYEQQNLVAPSKDGSTRESSTTTTKDYSKDYDSSTTTSTSAGRGDKTRTRTTTKS